MNVRMRAESSTPAMPTTRSRGNPLARYTTWHIASRGFVTGTMMQSGECFTTSAVTDRMMLAFLLSRSSRLMPGLRARPAVMTTMSDPAVSA